MRENFERAFRAVLKHEGGFVNHPDDPGGMTNLGVTKTVWEAWIGRAATEAEMRALTIKDVEPLYRVRYWNATRGDDLPSGVDYAVFDAAVNSGPTRATKWLQLAAGVEADGKSGPKTVAAAQMMQAYDLVQQICDRRLAFLQRLPIWRVFGKGWQARIAEVREKASALARHS